MGDEDSEEEAAVEVFGVLRLQLAPKTKSGYVGVRLVVNSKKRPWQAWVHIKGEKRRCLGSFKKPQEAAVARARSLLCDPETLPSPRKQAARNSGAAAYRPNARTFALLIHDPPLSVLRFRLPHVRSQTICRHHARTLHTSSRGRREQVASIYAGKRCKRLAAPRACGFHIQRTTRRVLCSDGSAAHPRPASAAGHSSFWHGSGCSTAAGNGRSRASDRMRTGSTRVRRSALLLFVDNPWISCG